MNCPRKDCGLPLWQYDELLLTCKRGHHTRRDDQFIREPVEGFRVPWTLLAALPGIAALILELLP